MTDRIPEIPLVPNPQTADAKRAVGFEWSELKAGYRHQLGGEPDWVQDPDVPICKSSGEVMTFYGQFDSIGDDYILADVGLIYVFVCFGCFTTEAVLQSS